MPRVKAFMPPQGLLLIAASIPPEWESGRDENMSRAKDEDFAWADAVFVTGMHVQRERINDVNERAHRFGKVTVLGGPSVSACAEWYPDFDLLHIGEIGDATRALYAHLDETVARPDEPLRFTTADRTPLTDFPTPAYELIDIKHYFLASVQFSSGCPYRCEFCDIPELYGRNPRLKTPEQVCRELDAIVAAGPPGAVYFVDDNFNRQPERPPWSSCRTSSRGRRGTATASGLPARRRSTSRRTRRSSSSCARRTSTRSSSGSRRRTPKRCTGWSRTQNLRLPILEAVAILNSYGMEVVSGIIMGLDQDTERTAEDILAFIEASKIPMLTINLLYALPMTPLWRRLEKEGRILSDGTGGEESNVKFLLPREIVRRNWLQAVAESNLPEKPLPPLPAPDREHVSAPVPAGSPAEGREGRRRQRTEDPRPDPLARRRPLGLPQHLLAHGPAGPEVGQHRGRHPRRTRRPPPDPLRPRLPGRRRGVLLLRREGERAPASRSASEPARATG